MLDWLPALGARRKAQQASRALQRGAVDEASAACRAYFARRFWRIPTELGLADAQMFVLTALCSALRGDSEELDALEEMANDFRAKNAVPMRAMMKWLSAALDGDVDFVLDNMPAPESIVAPHAPGIVLLAVERSSAVAHKHDKEIQHHLSRCGGTTEIQIRVACALAVAALRRGDRAAATLALAALPASAPPFHQVLAAMARDDVDTAGQLVGELPAEERAAAIAVSAALALGTSSATSTRALEVLGPHASSTMRAALSASLAVTLAREGQVKEARSVVHSETRGTPSPALAVAAAFVALVGGDAAEGQSALRSVPTKDRTAQALRLLAVALGGRGDDLLREISAKPKLRPEHREAVASALLFALARAGSAPSADDTPAWLLKRPDDPEALYAWGILRLRQGAADEAIAAFSEAVEARPELAALGDAPDVAAIVLARQSLLAGQTHDAMGLASRTFPARLTGTANRLAALAYVQSAARVQKVALSADALPSFIEKLAKDLSPSSSEAGLLAVLRGEVARSQIGLLMRSGAGKEALRHLDALQSSWDGHAAFLHVAVLLSHGDMKLEDAEKQLAEALASEPSHEGLRVLLAEAQTSLRGAEAGLTTLESAGNAPRGALLGQALASAYRSARRGLEAKRFGFAELRRAATAPAELLAELRSALQFEVPARTADTGRERIARVPLGSLIGEAGLAERVFLLLSRAGAAAERDPSSRGTLDAVMQRLKLAFMSNDLAAARAAEMEIVELMGRSQPEAGR